MSHILKEGPGAGYEISGKIIGCHLSKGNLTKKRRDDYGIEYSFDVQGTVKIEDLEFRGYYSGDRVDECTANIYSLSVMVDEDDGTDLDSLEESVFPIRFSIIYGGGYLHSTFDGDIDIDANDISYDSIPYDEPTSMYLELTDKKLIDYIDEAVIGENYYAEYSVYDYDGEIVDIFENDDDAIGYAKRNNCARVDLDRKWYDYYGNIVDIEFEETVWESED